MAVADAAVQDDALDVSRPVDSRATSRPLASRTAVSTRAATASVYPLVTLALTARAPSDPAVMAMFSSRR